MAEEDQSPTEVNHVVAAFKWRRNFMFMAVIFSISEAAVTTPIGYATALLEPKLGAISTGSGMLWVAVTCLLVAPFVVKSLGAKQSMLVGMTFNCGFAGLFALATHFPKGSSEQWAVAMVAPVCSGLGVGIIWTSQGAFFSATVSLVVNRSQRPKDQDPVIADPPPPVVDAIVESGEAETRSQSAASDIPQNTRSQSVPHQEEPRANRRRSLTVSDTKDLQNIRSQSVPWWLGRTRAMSSAGWAASGMVFTDPTALEIHPTPQEKEDEHNEDATLDRATATAMLGSAFAALFLATDVLMKMSASLLQGSFFILEFHDPFLETFPMFLGYFALSVVMVFAMATVKDPERGEQAASALESEACCDRMKGAVRLWHLPELWCFGLTTLTFGFAGGYMNGYVNGSLTAYNSKLGSSSIGALMALSALIAAGLSLLFGPLAATVGKGPIVVLGAVAFATIPIAALVGQPCAENDYWGAGLMFLYVMQGVGRAVYESTNKAVFADHFRGSQSAGAFANCMMMNAFSFFASAVFLLLPSVTPLAVVIVILAAITPPGYLLATWLHARRAKRVRASMGTSLQPLQEGS